MSEPWSPRVVIRYVQPRPSLAGLVTPGTILIESIGNERTSSLAAPSFETRKPDFYDKTYAFLRECGMSGLAV